MNQIPKVGDCVVALHFDISSDFGEPDGQGLIRDENGDVTTVDDNVTVPPGTQGTVTSVDERVSQIFVEWDNGCRLALIIGADQWEVLPESCRCDLAPQCHTLTRPSRCCGACAHE